MCLLLTMMSTSKMDVSKRNLQQGLYSRDNRNKICFNKVFCMGITQKREKTGLEGLHILLRHLIYQVIEVMCQA